MHSASHLHQVLVVLDYLTLYGEISPSTFWEMSVIVSNCGTDILNTAQNRPLFERQDRCSLFSVLCYFRYFVRE